MRRAFTTALLAASLVQSAAACGDGAAPDRGGPTAVRTASPSPAGHSGPPAPGTGASAVRVVYFSSAARTVAGAHEILYDRGALDRFAGRVTAADPQAAAGIRAAGQGTDFSRSVLVGWTAATGCSAATSARLAVVGRRLEVRVDQPKPPPECFAPFRLTVVFDVPRGNVPAQPEFS